MATFPNKFGYDVFRSLVVKRGFSVTTRFSNLSVALLVYRGHPDRDLLVGTWPGPKFFDKRSNFLMLNRQRPIRPLISLRETFYSLHAIIFAFSISESSVPCILKYLK
jgi:hypothetical protein